MDESFWEILILEELAQVFYVLSLPGLALWRLASNEMAIVFLVSAGSTDLVVLLSALPHPGGCGQSSVANFGGVNWVVNVPDGNLETVPADVCIGCVGPIEFFFPRNVCMGP